MEPCSRPSEGAQSPVPAISSRSVKNHAKSLCDFSDHSGIEYDSFHSTYQNKEIK